MVTLIAGTNSVNFDNKNGGVRKSNGNKGANSSKMLGATDNFESNKPRMPKLTPTEYKIKEGDSLQKIANALGLKLTDLVDQLKASGKLDKDYDPSARHERDLPWMKAGKSINVSYPKTEAQKAAYEIFTDARTKEYYNNKAKAK